MSDKNEVLTYKGRPLMRKDNLIYYGSMADAYIVMLQILESKKVGDMVEFGGLLGAAPIMPIKTGSPAKFINRGGRIPAPIQSLKN